MLRTLQITRSAYAVLCECKRGTGKWETYPGDTPDTIKLTVQSHTYDLLLEKMRELQLADLSATILFLYRNQKRA